MLLRVRLGRARHAAGPGARSGCRRAVALGGARRRRPTCRSDQWGNRPGREHRPAHVRDQRNPWARQHRVPALRRSQGVRSRAPRDPRTPRARCVSRLRSRGGEGALERVRDRLVAQLVGMDVVGEPQVAVVEERWVGVSDAGTRLRRRARDEVVQPSIRTRCVAIDGAVRPQEHALGLGGPCLLGCPTGPRVVVGHHDQPLVTRIVRERLVHRVECGGEVGLEGLEGRLATLQVEGGQSPGVAGRVVEEVVGADVDRDHAGVRSGLPDVIECQRKLAAVEAGAGLPEAAEVVGRRAYLGNAGLLEEVHEELRIAVGGPPLGDRVSHRHIQGGSGTRRPCGVGVGPGGVGEVGLIGAVGVHRVDLDVSISSRAEGDPLTVGRVRRPEVVRRVVAQVRLIRAVGVHRVDLEETVAVRGEADALAIRGPGRIAVAGRGVGEVDPVAAICVHHMDVGAGAEGDPPAVGRPGSVRVVRNAVREVLEVAAIGVHHVDLVVVAVAVRVERDLLTVGRPGRVKVLARAVGHVCLVAAVCVHGVDLPVPVAQGGEREPASVRRPGRLFIARGLVGEPDGIAAVGVHHIDLEIAVARRSEGDPRPASCRARGECLVLGADVARGALLTVLDAELEVVGRGRGQFADRLRDGVWLVIVDRDGADRRLAPVARRLAVLPPKADIARDVGVDVTVQRRSAIADVGRRLRPAYRAGRHEDGGQKGHGNAGSSADAARAQHVGVLSRESPTQASVWRKCQATAQSKKARIRYDWPRSSSLIKSP